MDLHDAIEWLEGHIHDATWATRSSRTGDVDLSLDRMQRFAAILGDPQQDLPVIHVTGTNGKGSTSRIITRLLMAEGLRVGTYSSPHLDSYRERFRIDDTDIDGDTLAELLTRMAAAEDSLGDRLKPFEVLTGAALRWFADERVDVAVVEVGVLGRFDATNIVGGRVAVVTNIGFDHTSGEGDWQLRIAAEKAGIVKPDAHLVLGDVEPRLVALFRAERPATVWWLGTDVTTTAEHAVVAGRRLTVTTPMQTLPDIDVPLHGPHQSRNAAVAIAAASAFLGRSLQPAAVVRGLAEVRMPARLEVVGERPRIILDGAHNPDAARALTVAMRTLACRGRRILVVGMLAGRDPVAMLDDLEAAGFDRVIACTAPTARARPAAEIVAAANSRGIEAIAADDAIDALRLALGDAGPHDQVLVTGSIYLVAAARGHLVGAAVRTET